MAITVRGGTCFHGDPPVVREGDLHLAGGHVVAQVPKEDSHTLRASILNARGCLVLPGFVIAHHHLYSALARGMPGPASAPRSFLEILGKVWWRLDRALDGDLCEVSALVGTLEALRCGVTGVVDHHASPAAIEGSLDRLASGVRQAGGRAVLCYEATDRHGPEGFEAGLAENARFLKAPRDPCLRAMVGGHAPFTLSDAHLGALAELAAAHSTAVHLHVAEAVHDQEDARARGFADVTARLEAAGILAGDAILAHGVHLGAGELERIAGTRAWLTHQPRSNMNNHVGYFGSARGFPRLALGTDGINGDILDEAHGAFFRLREHDGAAGAETVWSWLAGSRRLMSQAFGLPDQRCFGCLDPGCPADVIVVEYDAPTPVTGDNLPWHLAFGIGARHIRDVIVAGEVVIRDRRPVRIEPIELARRAHAAAQRLWARMQELPEG